MRNLPERYVQTLEEHFAVAPTWIHAAGTSQRPQESSAVSSWTTNQDGKGTAFQRWFHFKEAFSPSFVSAAVASLGYRPTHIVDPFGGSGTSAITAQLLSVEATTVEVNPFLADVIKAKLSPLTAEQLRRAAADFQARLSVTRSNVLRFAHLPDTFIESSEKERWIFPLPVARRLSQYIACIDVITDADVQRFFKVVLGAVLVDCSNVYVNGKGRRYRGAWQDSQPTPKMLDEHFGRQFNTSFEDVLRFEGRPRSCAEVLQGDSRSVLKRVTKRADLIVFSPPYPNSFDYTDIYNVELWMLGYISCSAANIRLRNQTLRSHVQINRVHDKPLRSSKRLALTLEALDEKQDQLWDSSIPGMVGSYFRDMENVLEHCRRLISARGKVILVVGDSRYADVRIEVAPILCELATAIGFSSVVSREVRHMRSSAQQGGRLQLAESIVELMP